MKKKYLLTVQQLHDAVQYTIKVFNDYKLERNLGPNNAYTIYGPGYFLRFQYFTVEGGCEIKTVSGKILGKITEEAARTNVNEFYRRIDQIVTKKIALTPDILNKDVYKSGSTIIAAIQLVKLIVAIVAIVLAIMALVH